MELRLGVLVTVGDGLDDFDSEMEGVGVPLLLGDAPTLRLAVADGVALAVGEGVLVGDEVDVGVAETVLDAVGEPELVGVPARSRVGRGSRGVGCQTPMHLSSL